MYAKQSIDPSLPLCKHVRGLLSSRRARCRGEYPNLIKQGERVTTIAVPTALVAFNFPAKSNRFERLARFVDYLFWRIEKLPQPGFDPKWKSINLAATVPGLARFPAAQGGSIASRALRMPIVSTTVRGCRSRQPCRRSESESRSGATLFACCSPFQTVEALAFTLHPGWELLWMQCSR
jgi:hypothetical protein